MSFLLIPAVAMLVMLVARGVSGRVRNRRPEDKAARRRIDEETIARLDRIAARAEGRRERDAS